MSDLNSITETWIEFEDALLLIINWVDPRISVGAARLHLEEARNSGLVQLGWRFLSPEEERLPDDDKQPFGMAARRFVFVKEDLEYYCGLKLGFLKKAGAALTDNDPGGGRPYATTLQIRKALDAEVQLFTKRGDKAPNVNDIVDPIKRRLEEQGLSTTRRDIQTIYDLPEFKKLRGRSGVRREYRRR
jgi:hypothetical protein